jgi:multidrug resistance efflux pump
MNEKFKIAALILFSMLVIIFLAACSSKQSGGAPGSIQVPQGSGAPPTGQPPAGVPGSLPVAPGGGKVPTAQKTITLPNQTNTAIGTGTVTVATYAKLYFGSAGQVASVNVKQSDRVTSGMVLAKLSTATLEATLAQSQTSIDQVRANIDQARQNLLQDQQNLVLAQQNLNAQKDVLDIQTRIDNANIQLQQARLMLNAANSSGNGADVKYWVGVITSYAEDTNPNSSGPGHKANGGLIGMLKNDMSKLLEDPAHAGATLVTNATSATEIQRYTLAVQIAQQKIVTDQANLTMAESNLNTAKKNFSLIQLQLDQATIIAPFDGIIAQVYPQAGDILPAPSQSQNPVIYMIDPATMQLNIYVNELDMPLVKIKQKAKVSINAFPDAKIDGIVTAISPVPTTLGGVIYYSVTISFSVPSGVDVRIGMNGSATLAIQ